MNVLLTGGFGNLGRLITSSLIGRGYFVIILDKNIKNESAFIEKNQKIKYYQIDFSNDEELLTVLDNILSTYKRIDIIINNAAVREFNSFEKFTKSDIDLICNVNFKTPLLIINKILRVMCENNFGRIINISSISALHGYSSGTLYCSTKNGLVTFTESLSGDLNKLNKNITANVLLPDSFQTRKGIKLNDYNLIVNQIIYKINTLISNKINGKVILIAPFFKKIFLLARIIIRSLMRIFS